MFFRYFELLVDCSLITKSEFLVLEERNGDGKFKKFASRVKGDFCDANF